MLAIVYRRIFILLVAFLFDACDQLADKNAVQGPPYAFEALAIELEEIPLIVHDTIYTKGDTIFMSIIDSSFMSGPEEGMVNDYIINEAIVHSPSVKYIKLDKGYPEREAKEFSTLLSVSSLSHITNAFGSNNTFHEMAEYLVKHPKGRKKDEWVLISLTSSYAILKFGSLEKSWGENIFEILYPFCQECETGKKGPVYKDMQALRKIAIDGLPEKKKPYVNEIFDTIFSKCDKAASKTM